MEWVKLPNSWWKLNSKLDEGWNKVPVETIVGNFLDRFDYILNLEENKKERYVNNFKRLIFSQNIIKEEEIDLFHWEYSILNAKPHIESELIKRWILNSGSKNKEIINEKRKTRRNRNQEYRKT